MNGQSENKNNSEHDKVYTLIVNGREKTWNEKEISFEQVVILAFGSFNPDPNMIYTITFKRGNGNNPEGVMEVGSSLKVKEGMIFNVSTTNRS
jgi:hypothetical protein